MDLKTYRAEQRARSNAAADAAFDAIYSEPPKGSPPKFQLIDPGSAPPFGLRETGPSMSLGTRRPCNDLPTSPAPALNDAVIEDDYQNPRIACIEWQRITYYTQRKPKPAVDQPPKSTDSNLTRGIFNGYLSPATRRKIRKAVSTWIRSVMIYRAEIKRRYDPGRAYPVFLTVTLPSDQVHSDKEITRKVLGPFIQALKRQHGIEHYFWRAEAQDNGRIHYHMLTDRYIDKLDLQATWNRCVNVLGYVDRYYEKTGSAEPPSTEIHRVTETVIDKKTGKRRTVDPVEYLIAYALDTAQPEALKPGETADPNKPRRLVGKFRKADGSIGTFYTRPIDGRVWGMSDSLRDLREPRCIATRRLTLVMHRAHQMGKLRRIESEHSVMYFGPVSQILQTHHPGFYQLIRDYYVNVFASLYPAQLPPEIRAGTTWKDPANLWLDLLNFGTYYNEPEEPAVDVMEAVGINELESVTVWDRGDWHRMRLGTYFDRYPYFRKALQ